VDDFASKTQGVLLASLASLVEFTFEKVLLPPALPSGLLWLRGSWSKSCVKYTVNALNRNSFNTAKWQSESHWAETSLLDTTGSEAPVFKIKLLSV